MLRHGRTGFLILAAGLAVYVFLTLHTLPPRVASHFDAAGVPNGWSSRPPYALLLLSIGILLPLGMVSLIRIVSRGGPSRLNIPARDYWSRPQNRDECIRRVRVYIWWLACVMAGTAVLIHALVLSANSRQPPRLSTSTFILVLATVGVGILGWTVGWYRLLRPPRGE